MSEEKKLTDEQILTALEKCLSTNGNCTCTNCKFYTGNGYEECIVNVSTSALKFIQRLQKENETIKAELCKECEEHEEFTKKAKEEIIEWNKLFIEQKAEIERLTLAVEGFKGENKVVHKENDELLGKIERLTKENSNVISMNDALYREKAELQKQVDDLQKENRDGKQRLLG